MSSGEYLYGSVACFDQVDPDFLSMIELNAMAALVNVEGDLYQFLWPLPGKGIGDGLLSIECEDDVLAFIKARNNVGEDGISMGPPFRSMKLYVKTLSEFEARKRIGQIKMELHRAAFERRVMFRLEEIDEDEEDEGSLAPCTNTGLVATNVGSSAMLALCAPQQTDVDNSVIGPDVVAEPATVVVDMNGNGLDLELATDEVEVNGNELGAQPATDSVEVNGNDFADLAVNDTMFEAVPDHVVNGAEVIPDVINSEPIPDVVELNADILAAVLEDRRFNPEPIPDEVAERCPLVQNDPQDTDVGTRWLGVDEVLAEMEREESLNQPLDDDDDGWSSPTIYSSSDTPGEFWDGRYNPYSSEDDSDPVYFANTPVQYSSEDDSDPAYVANPSSPSSVGYSNYTSTGPDSEARGTEVVSDADSNRAEDSDARNDDDEGDRFVHEEEMITERGWGSEEDDEHRPDRYPIFCSSRDMDAAEILIGREFESFAQFKEFCKVNAVKNRRGVKFPVNDKIRCKCVCVKECGFWLSARIRGGSDSVVLISGQPEHDCLVEEDIRAANPAFLAKHYVARFRIDPAWSLRNFVHTVITDFGLKINVMKAYRAKRAALTMIHGEENDQFKKLWDYGAELQRTNPGTTVDIRYDGLTFQAIYICLDALKKGFKAGCRQFIGLDGCHLKNIPGWQLLAAVGVDGNDGMFPIAWAIVEKESEDTWGWFMELLKGDLGIPNAPGWTFMSDRQKVCFNKKVPLVQLV
ncbi:hypothetical protein LINPERPRIM_LOCUS17933 [Linum perenne]